jgi:1-deoxy-D-xylulose-5-phosphate reductoisomerase
MAVAAFLERRIRFTEIATIIEFVLNAEAVVSVEALQAVLRADSRARELVQGWLRQHGC